MSMEHAEVILTNTSNNIKSELGITVPITVDWNFINHPTFLEQDHCILSYYYQFFISTIISDIKRWTTACDCF